VPEEIMSDEFDEILDLSLRATHPRPAETSGAKAVVAAPRLVARLYTAANAPLRARLLACLMRPLGPLGVAGVAAGAFAGFLGRRGVAPTHIDLEGVARVSSEEVLELARFVEQVSPEALQHFAGLVSASQLGLATFSASALVLLYRALHASPEHSTSTRSELPPRAVQPLP
jgi:hypothetical protein